jgi:hypothetical protein
MGPFRQEAKIADRKKENQKSERKKNKARRAKSSRKGGGRWRVKAETDGVLKPRQIRQMAV